MSRTKIHVRNLRLGEATVLPAALLDHGMPFLDPEWIWVIESAPPIDPITLLTSPLPTPFALVVCSFAHGWLVLWRVLAISPLPPQIPLSWFKEALPQVFAEARQRGCIGFLTFLADDQSSEVKLARIISRMSGGALLPFQGSIGAGRLLDPANAIEVSSAAVSTQATIG